MIWKRYLLIRLMKSFAFMLISAFVLFSIVDLSTRGKSFYSTFSETVTYCAFQFSTYFSLLTSLSFLLATIQVLHGLNTHHELVALQMGGLSRKKLLVPFFVLATLLFAAALANHQWISPFAQTRIKTHDTAHAKQKKRKIREHVQTMVLEDGTELVYQSFDEKKRELFDVFWIENPSNIWHMKFFQVDPPIGRFVDCFQRNEERLLVKTETFEKRPFPEIRIANETAFKPFTPFEIRPLLQLASQALDGKGERYSVLAHFLYKLSQPFLLFLILITIGPIGFQFSRAKPTFLIVAFGLFGFIAMMTILDGMLILAENRVLPAAIAFSAPFLLTLAFSYPRYAKL